MFANPIDELGLSVVCTGEDTFPVCDSIRSIPGLIALRSESNDLNRFRVNVAGLREQNTQTLVIRIGTTVDPLTLWALHLELDRREIPPALRWPTPLEASGQLEFVVWLADVYWLAKRNPNHCPNFRSMTGMFKHSPASGKWHNAAHWCYLRGYRRNGSGHYFAKGFGLTMQQRQLLMCFPTNQMRAERRTIEKLSELRQQLFERALEYPDKSGQRNPRTVADRRAALWRTYILSGRNCTLAAKYHTRITGEVISRQALAKQIAIVSEARSRNFVS